MYKISVHLVYSIALKEIRAAALRQHCVENLQFLSERRLQNKDEYPTQAETMAKRARQQNLSLDVFNTWESVFDSVAVAGGNGLRVPLNDERERPPPGCINARQ